jgi:P27 family predicted phage terminase small subunit
VQILWGGPMKKIKQDILSLVPPPGLDGKEAKKIYKQLSEMLRDAGLAKDIDAETVAMAASSIVRVRRLRQEADKVTDLTVMSAKGTVMVHPIFAELRREESRLQSVLDRLYLTPKSRQAKSNKDDVSRGLQASKTIVDPEALKLLG